MNQAAPDLGPFRAPSSLEPEFHAPTPRPVPPELKRGAYEQKRRALALGLVLFGILALLAYTASRGTNLDHYFLALPWFQVVGVASIALGVVTAVVQQLAPGQYAVSTSNRNFEGRQGRGGRTFLASPLTAAAAAVTGKISDARALLEGGAQ